MALSATVLAASPAAAQAPPAQGIQLGQPFDLTTTACNRSEPVTLFLGNPALLARTSWLRLDLRGAGGGSMACANLSGAYRSFLDELALLAPQIQVIGLLSNQFIEGSFVAGQPYDVQAFATAAGTVACNTAAYDQVDVWEVWNEPNLDLTWVTPDQYAQMLGLASAAIRSCGEDTVISGGLAAEPVFSYLDQVDQQIRLWHYGGYERLATAVDGIGIHPYVGNIDSYLSDVSQYAAVALDNLPLYITEFGWQVTATLNEANQCRNLVDAFALINTRWAGIVPAATWFTLQDWAASPTEYYTGGLYDLAWVPRPALTGYLQERCPPMTPTNATATPLDATRVRVRWTDNSTNESGFEVYNGVSYARVGPNVTEYTWTGLAGGAYMCFSVHAFNSEGNSPDTPYACTTTPNSTLSVAVTGNDYQVYSRAHVLGGSWSNWVAQGRPSVGVQGGPAIVYRTNDTYIIFARGGDNALWYKVSGGSWASIGRPNGVSLASDPDATSWGYGTARVFVTAADGRVYHADFGQGVSPTWQGSIGSPVGNATSGPSVVSWSDGSGLHLRVFVRDQNGELRSLAYNNGWQQGDWNHHGGYIYSGTSPEAAIRDYLHMDVYVIGGDRLLYEKSYNAGSWSDWRPLSGGVIGGPGAAALNSQIDLFVRGNDNALYQKTCRPRSGEIATCQDENGSWTYLGGGLKSDPDADWT